MNTPNNPEDFDYIENPGNPGTPPPDRELTLAICTNMAENGRLFVILAFLLALVAWQHVGSTGKLFALAAGLQLLALAAAVWGDGSQLNGTGKARLWGLAAHVLAGAGLALTLLLALVLS